MTKSSRLTVLGLFAAAILVGCTGDDGPAVPKGAGADTVANKSAAQTDPKAKKTRALSNAMD